MSSVHMHPSHLRTMHAPSHRLINDANSLHAPAATALPKLFEQRCATVLSSQLTVRKFFRRGCCRTREPYADVVVEARRRLARRP
jgi:hypothetical protein